MQTLRRVVQEFLNSAGKSLFGDVCPSELESVPVSTGSHHVQILIGTEGHPQHGNAVINGLLQAVGGKSIKRHLFMCQYVNNHLESPVETSVSEKQAAVGVTCVDQKLLSLFCIVGCE